MAQVIKFERTSERGNVFLAIFGAIALVGVLGASIMTFMKGPLSASVRLTKISTAENQMQIGSQVAVMATSSQVNKGDCDADGYVEPMEWRTPAVSIPFPVGGGLVPLSLGINKKDPWGTEYGYCVWNHGPTTAGNGCGANMLQGTASHAYPVVALISAGPDKAFTTTCRDFSVADVVANGVLTDPTDLPLVSKAAEADDDIITSFTYDEASGVSGGLWSIKPTDPAVAVINKSIETTGVANLKGGILLPDKSLLDCNDITNAGVMAKSAAGIEICDGAGTWQTIGSSGSSTPSGITFVGVNSGHTPGVSDGCGENLKLTIQKPSGAVAGDVLIYAISTDNAGCGSNLTWPSGFTQLQSGGTADPDGQCSAIAYKIATGSETNLDFFDDSTCSLSGSVVAYTGVDSTSPIIASNQRYNNNASVPVTTNSNSLTTTDANAQIVWFAAADTDGSASGYNGSGSSCTSKVTTYTEPSGFTKRTDIQGTANFFSCFNSMAIADKIQAVAGATGALAGSMTSTGGGSASTNVMLVALKPAAASGGGGGGGGSSDAFGTTSTCSSAADAGKIRYNSVSGKPEFCDGTAWTPFALSTPTGQLVVSPASHSTMNVTGPTTTGSWVIFTVSNKGLSATPVLAVPTITGANATNFEIDTAASTCDNGIALAAANVANNSCTVVLRAKVTGNSSYSAQLNIVAGSLSATVPLYGTGSGFACASGSFGWGGIVVGACTGTGGTVPGNNQLIVQRAGCTTATVQPSCTDNPSDDPFFRATDDPAMPYAAQNTSGAINTVSILAYGRTAPAAEYCNNLVMDGYSDWFLPSYEEAQAFYADSVVRTKFSSNWYASSSYAFFGYGYDRWHSANPSNGGENGQLGSNDYYVLRCARRHDAAAPTAVSDSDPEYLIAPLDYQSAFSYASYTPNLSTIVISDPIAVTGYNVPITVQVSGSGSPQVRVNGGAWATSVVINPSPSNPVVELRATSPASYGTQTAVTVNFGTEASTWNLRTYDSTIVKNIFVTSTTYTGNLGGLAGANTKCQTQANAGGLASPTTYKSLISISTSSPFANIGWNWGILQNVGVNSVVAASPAALVKGALSSPPNRTESGALRSTNVWMGTAYNDAKNGDVVQRAGSTSDNCNNWASATGTRYGSFGASGANTYDAVGQSSGNERACNLTASIYCVGPF